MEQNVYQKLVAIQREVEDIRKGLDEPYWFSSTEHGGIMARYEELMESEEAKAELPNGSRTFEIEQAQGGPVYVIQQVKADSFEEAFFKWLIATGLDNPYRQQELPHQHGDTVDYEGIQATFFERDTLHERLVQEILLDKSTEFSDAKTEEELEDAYGTKDRAEAFKIYARGLRKMDVTEIERHYPDYKYVRLGLNRLWYDQHREDYQEA